jgi:hypothetical protein
MNRQISRLISVAVPTRLYGRAGQVMTNQSSAPHLCQDGSRQRLQHWSGHQLRATRGANSRAVGACFHRRAARTADSGSCLGVVDGGVDVVV